MSRKLRGAVIGVGGIANTHLKSHMAHPEVEIVALCDINKERAQAKADELGIAHVYTDYRDVLKHDDIDFVDICTPNLYHSEIAVAALLAGKHVFTEKPDAINPVEAQRMADTAKQTGKHLMAMRNNRFGPGSQFLKKYIDKGNMGEVYTARCGWLRRRGIPGKGGWFTTKELSGGGPLIDLGVHFIDVAVWLMGNPKPVAVMGATYCKFANTDVSDSEHSQFGEKADEGTFDVEDLASGFIRFDNGATLHIEFSWASNVEEEVTFVELRGTKAGSSLRSGAVKLFHEMEGVMCTTIPDFPQKSIGNHQKNLNHFIDVLQGRAEPIFLPEQGVDMIKILSALYESASTGREVRMD